MAADRERQQAGAPRADEDKAPAGKRAGPDSTRKDDRSNEPPAGEDLTGEGSPGLTITGGSGHA